MLSFLQKCLADLRGNLSTISSTASRGQHDLKTAIQEALGAIMQSEDSFVNSAMEVPMSHVKSKCSFISGHDILSVYAHADNRI